MSGDGRNNETFDNLYENTRADDTEIPNRMRRPPDVQIPLEEVNIAHRSYDDLVRRVEELEHKQQEMEQTIQKVNNIIK